MLSEFIKAFISLLVIVNPFSSIPVFVALTEGHSKKKFREAAHKAISTASIILFVFLFTGTIILDLFGISMSSFKIAGGIILLVIGIKHSLNLHFTNVEKFSDMAIVPLATPLTVGPATIATVILLVHDYGYLITAIASICVLFIAWLGFRYSLLITKILGHQGTIVFSRTMGVLITALAVEFIRQGVKL